VFSEEFDGEALGASWRTGSERWRIDEGELAVERAFNDALWLDFELPEAVRIEFDARSLSPVGDLKFEVFGDGATHESGYIGIFGGWNNQVNTIARLDEHGADRIEGQRGVRVTPEQTYRFAIVRTDHRVRWFVDGRPFLTFADGEPLRGESHRYFAFNNWEVPLRFDRVAIYDLGAAEAAP
jgi:hypothetical protein